MVIGIIKGTEYRRIDPPEPFDSRKLDCGRFDHAMIANLACRKGECMACGLTALQIANDAHRPCPGKRMPLNMGRAA